jgi:hypothetical protein
MAKSQALRPPPTGLVDGARRRQADSVNHAARRLPQQVKIGEWSCFDIACIHIRGLFATTTV